MTVATTALAARISAKPKRKPTALLAALTYPAVTVAVVSLVAIIVYVLIKGIPHLSFHFLFGKYSADAPAIGGVMATTLKLILVTVLLAVPVGTLTAVFLTEYTGNNAWIVRLVRVIRVAVETLAGVPSIIFGFVGMLVFIELMGLGYGVWAGSFTLTLMILPTVISTVEQSLLTVPDAYREGSLALGATRLRTTFRAVLPSAAPGVLTAVILSVGRVVSESACLIYTCGITMRQPKTFGATGASLAVAMYVQASEGYFDNAYAIGVVLIVLVLFVNVLAAAIAKKFSVENER